MKLSWRLIFVVLGSVLFAFTIGFVDAVGGINLGPGLSVAAATALLGVTWIYTRHTKNLVDAQTKQYLAQQRQSHYSAASRLWGISLGAENLITKAELTLPDLVATSATPKSREEASRKLGDIARGIGDHASEIMKQGVEVDGDLEGKAISIAGHCLETSGDLFHLSTLFFSELNKSTLEGRNFSLEHVVHQWENPADEDERPSRRWSEFIAGSSLASLDQEFTDFRMACRSELKTRSAALLA